MKKILLIMILFIVFASMLLAERISINKNNVNNYTTKIEKLTNVPNYIEEDRISHNEEYKLDSITYIDSLIVNEKQLKYETAEVAIFNPIIHMFVGDARLLEIYYRLIIFGDDFSKKIAIDGITYWWDVPKDIDHLWSKGGEYVIIDIDSTYILQMKELLTFELNKLLYHPSTALKVSAATTLVKLGCSNKMAIDILKHCSIFDNSLNWDLTDTIIYKTIRLKSYYRKGKNESERRIDAINEIIKKANEGLNLLNQNKNPLNEVESSDDKEDNDLTSRESDWNSYDSSVWCEEYWGPEEADWSDDFIHYPQDCANFASQCLIAGGFELTSAASAYFIDGVSMDDVKKIFKKNNKVENGDKFIINE